ncbi:uncharacterized protein LOC123969737 [Micropterus dolomieu]|uniref:uncharacterized protein LOC123969737 n=1 Tax=Micropterus dolomieu TaxID=147949 RepID=UPI001E8CB529|nr:uncharacterized protein LOC123969737 [Micropterus dolomieu]
MGATWISWRTTTTVIITILQIQALISVRTTAVTGVEGQRFDFRCVYPDGWVHYHKYFCRDNDGNVSSNTLIRTDKQNQWETKGRFSLFDNTSGAFFIVRVDKLFSSDSGTYRCGVDVSHDPDYISFILLNVSRELHLPLYLTAVMCMAAILCVCLFTLCLLLAVKQRRPAPRHSREISSDYETMMPGVRTEPELGCSCSAPDCADLSALPLPPPDLCSHFTSKHRESTVTLGLDEYADVDVPGHICRYQHLDPRRLEEHVYHSLHGNSGPKDGPLGVEEQIN